jgi:hypothetical protein
MVKRPHEKTIAELDSISPIILYYWSPVFTNNIENIKKNIGMASLQPRRKDQQTMTPESLLIRTALNSWKQIIAQVDKTLASFSDEDLQREVAPGRNRLYYLLGHLTAVHDRLFPLLRLGDRLHSEFDDEFVVAPDAKLPHGRISPSNLRKAWSEVNQKLTAAFETLRPEEWLERHNAVSEEDFAKEPLRNRLAVVMSRTTHAAVHEGQMRLASR